MKNNYKTIRVGGKLIQEHRYIIEKKFGKIPEGYVVNHKNGIKNDNRLENLEVITQAQNCQHAIKSGFCKTQKYVFRGEIHGKGKVIMKLKTCEKCGYKWQPRVEHPKKCPYCLKRFKTNDNKNRS